MLVTALARGPTVWLEKLLEVAIMGLYREKTV
jgi:hypothetical protein